MLLAIYDSIFLVCVFITHSLPALINPTEQISILPFVEPWTFLPGIQISLTGSIYTVIVITIVRYISVCYPHHKLNESKWISFWAISIIVIFSFALNVPRFFEYRFTWHKFHPCELHQRLRGIPESEFDNKTIEGLLAAQRKIGLEISTTKLRENPYYVRYYHLLFNCTMNVILPLLLLGSLNYKIYLAIKKRDQFLSQLNSSSSREQQTGEKHSERAASRILLTIVIIFFICHIFKVVIIAYEVAKQFSGNFNYEKHYFPFWVELLLEMNHVALAFNASVNIGIYIYNDQRFRKAVMGLVHPLLNFRRSSPNGKIETEVEQKATQMVDTKLFTSGKQKISTAVIKDEESSCAV